MGTYNLTINGTATTVTAEPNDYLLYILRDKLDLTGPKYGCGVGVCGACTCNSDTPITAAGNTVATNSPYSEKSRFAGIQPTTQKRKFRSCVTRISDVAGKSITTIEGLGADPLGAKLQASWKKFDVAQCGFCQAGQLMTAYELLQRNPRPTDEDIINAMQANLCRCGTYPRIKAAIKDAAGISGDGYLG